MNKKLPINFIILMFIWIVLLLLSIYIYKNIYESFIFYTILLLGVPLIFFSSATMYKKKKLFNKIIYIPYIKVKKYRFFEWLCKFNDTDTKEIEISLYSVIEFIAGFSLFIITLVFYFLSLFLRNDEFTKNSFLVIGFFSLSVYFCIEIYFKIKSR